jgi:hypothetical protein
MDSLYLFLKLRIKLSGFPGLAYEVDIMDISGGMCLGDK